MGRRRRRLASRRRHSTSHAAGRIAADARRTQRIGALGRARHRRTCIRMRSSARWRAWPSARPHPAGQFLDLARDHVPLRRALRSGRAARGRRAALRRDARSRLHHGLRIPLSAPPARRPPVRRSGGDVAGADRRRARHRHPPDPAAGAVHDRRLRRPRRWPSASGASATTSKPICACSTRCARERTRSLRIGCALHSLRAVPAEAMRDVLGRACRATARCTSTSPSRSAKCRIAWRCAARGRSNGCSTTPTSMRAGRWCTPRT